MAMQDDKRSGYRAPSLKVYGGMAELTAGGTGDKSEDDNDTQNNPNKQMS